MNKMKISLLRGRFFGNISNRIKGAIDSIAKPSPMHHIFPGQMNGKQSAAWKLPKCKLIQVCIYFRL